jgi:hypothetical protein
LLFSKKLKVYAVVPKNTDVTSDLVVKEFKRKFPKEKSIEDIFGIDSDYDEGRRVKNKLNFYY